MISTAQIPFRNLAVRKPLQIDSISFSYTGAIQKFIVPNKVTSIKVQAIGAKGGTGGGGQTGGAGANITTTLNVTPGQVLYIVVGGFPGQSSTAKYGFGGNGGIANSSSGYGGAGGGLSGVFSTSTPSVASALLVAGGGGGGSGTGGSSGYTGGAALNTSTGSAANGAGSTGYPISTRYQFGYGASLTGPGVGGYAYDNAPAQNGGDGNNINGGAGGPGTVWQGAGGGGAGYYGGGGGAGGGDANGGGGGGSTKSSSSFSIFGTANSTGDGSVTIICLSNSGLVLNLDAGNTNSYSGTGTTWTDLSGNSLNGSISNGTFSSTSAVSLIFNGSNTSVQIPNTTELTNSATISLWVYPNKYANTGNSNDAIFVKHDRYSNNGFCLIFNSTGFSYSVKPTSNSGAVNNVYNSPINKWYYITLTMNQTQVLFYVNGVLAQTNTVTNAWSFSSDPFYLGTSPDSFWGKFSGNISNVTVYNRVLTTQEIINNFNAQRFRFGQ